MRVSKQSSTNAEFDFVCFALCNSYAFSSLSAHSSGTLDDRASRLFSLKGLRRDEYPMKIRGKNFIL